MKKKTSRDRRINQSIFSFRNIVLYFLMIAFVVTCSFYLFIKTNNLSMNRENTTRGAILTFINVFILCTFISIEDAIWRKRNIKKQLVNLLDGVQKIANGNFSVRIQKKHSMLSTCNEFDVLIEDFNRMAEELSGIETLRTDFIANVSHELKTPLATIQNYATVMQTPNLSEERRIEYSSVVMKETKKLSELITNILKLNKLENQQIYPNTKEYDLGEQLCECLLNFETEWESKKINIENKITDNVKITADYDLLNLVWNNLFSNALKFTDVGGKVEVKLYVNADSAIVSVSDTGCGMTKETMNHIFEKFYQGDTSHKTKGNGLGLALAKRVVEICKGNITVDSELQKGTTFTVTLPHTNCF